MTPRSERLRSQTLFSFPFFFKIFGLLPNVKNEYFTVQSCIIYLCYCLPQFNLLFLLSLLCIYTESNTKAYMYVVNIYGWNNALRRAGTCGIQFTHSKLFFIVFCDSGIQTFGKKIQKKNKGFKRFWLKPALTRH